MVRLLQTTQHFLPNPSCPPFLKHVWSQLCHISQTANRTNILTSLQDFVVFKQPIKKSRVNLDILCTQSSSFFVRTSRQKREAKRDNRHTTLFLDQRNSRKKMMGDVVQCLASPVSKTSAQRGFRLGIRSCCFKFSFPAKFPKRYTAFRNFIGLFYIVC